MHSAMYQPLPMSIRKTQRADGQACKMCMCVYVFVCVQLCVSIILQGEYDASTNASVWERRPVPVIKRLIRIGEQGTPHASPMHAVSAHIARGH